MAHLGLRWSELAGLRVGDADLVRNLVFRAPRGGSLHNGNWRNRSGWYDATQALSSWRDDSHDLPQTFGAWRSAGADLRWTQKALRQVPKCAHQGVCGMNKAQAVIAIVALTWALVWSRLSESNRRPIHYE